ncbi:FAD linked oxidase [Pochonia chlamydosporia 170]|uniref:FAD linked oxidase n=1 Tax=Pochonia chlamydosporia 170 TaxID=1380566 RepID=A0A179F4I0_METCM|nr:FAD linked oxidase [Pochonia chlamydosporia 170]OAQ60338.1 FAD linked oxidase [Pochonia chlamydosporia 170]
MGLIAKAAFSSLIGTTGLAAYLAAKNPVISPIAASDAIWSSKLFKRYNPSANPATQDVCIKRIPLDKIRPELLKNPGDLALEYCRGVWAGFEIQRRYLQWKYYGPETNTQLWTKQQLSESKYEKGTCIVDHFEVVEKTPTAITVRCGDSPRNQALRGSDGLFIIGAVVDHTRGEVELTLKSLLFSSQGKVLGVKGPMPSWMEELHQWYARIWSETGSRILLK